MHNLINGLFLTYNTYYIKAVLVYSIYNIIKPLVVEVRYNIITGHNYIKFLNHRFGDVYVGLQNATKMVFHTQYLSYLYIAMWVCAGVCVCVRVYIYMYVCMYVCCMCMPPKNHCLVIHIIQYCMHFMSMMYIPCVYIW